MGTSAVLQLAEAPAGFENHGGKGGVHRLLQSWQRSVIVSRGLYEYSVRESPRAKHIGLKVSLQKRLEVIVPVGFDRYVFIHELCHTIHMNHSQKYWAFLASREPEYVSLDKELRGACRVETIIGIAELF